MYKINELPTPCFVIDEGKLEENLKLLHQVEERTTGYASPLQDTDFTVQNPILLGGTP